MQHIKAARDTIRWLKSTADYAVVYRKDSRYERNNVSKCYQFYCDSDFANERPGRRSTTGTVAMFSSAPVQWRSSQQRLAAQSTAEAEYISLAHLVRDLKYLHKLNCEIFGPQSSSLEKAEQAASAADLKRGEADDGMGDSG